MKRTLDIGLSAALLLLGWPLLLLVALAIRLESSGPAIFKQTRVGRYGQHFTCYKYRTMFLGTAEMPTHQVSTSSITYLGRYLRLFKIDELPQLLNVLRGDMSLVGPRPCLPSQIELIDARMRLGILVVRPGVTGLAQVKAVDMSRVDLLAQVDAEYVNRRTFFGDAKLLWATLCGHGVGIDKTMKA